MLLTHGHSVKSSRSRIPDMSLTPLSEILQFLLLFEGVGSGFLGHVARANSKQGHRPSSHQYVASTTNLLEKTSRAPTYDLAKEA